MFVLWKITEKDRQIQIHSKAIDDLNDNETQILLVGDPSQIAALQVGRVYFFPGFFTKLFPVR